ncbi:MAG: alpha-galactosidase [Planctomycetes bacterium]|nr:alpha-galactosidase [Planctomycetota bacterium]
MVSLAAGGLLAGLARGDGDAAPDWLIDPAPYAARVIESDDGAEIVLTNGLIRRVFRLSPNAATVGLDQLTSGEALLRGVKPEAVVEIDGVRFEVGGLRGQPNYAYLKPEWLAGLEADPAAFRFVGYETGKPEARMEWKRVRHHAPDVRWPPGGVQLRMDYRLSEVASERLAEVRRPRAEDLAQLRVSVHYELYDGIPCYSKWIRLHNPTTRSITLNSFTSEILAAVEFAHAVEDRNVGFPIPNIHVETDYAFGGFTPAQSCRLGVHWVPDPEYQTQVNYLKNTPCLLEVRPTIGPEQDVPPGGTFESFRAFVLPYDSTDRERQGLALRRMYRTVAPWVTENPLMMHVRYADWNTVKSAIDQCAEVGFEMVILTFGSGFNIEDERPEYLDQMKMYADYARSKGIEIGGYSLLASRRIDPPEDNCIDPVTGRPGGGTFGFCPALASGWGQAYFRKLYRFFETTGFSLLEHDGSYPGDLDAAARPPLQKGANDSRWVQWRIITDFYKFCRARGVYLNVPDYYYLSGSTKCGMGYRETNWSLPRAQQVIHTRQNIYDGTWQKTPSMGWMFVPLTQYHGGGAAATIEPLDEHLEHYERMLCSNLAFGVQACYRGPRLFDTERTRDLVKKWVDWYKKHRAILESDLIHGRRADARDLDWMLHANPRLPERGLLVVFNPLSHVVERTIRVNLYYTGLSGSARVREGEGEPRLYPLARDYSIELPVRVAPEGMSWYVIEAPERSG